MLRRTGITPIPPDHVLSVDAAVRMYHSQGGSLSPPSAFGEDPLWISTAPCPKTCNLPVILSNLRALVPWSCEWGQCTVYTVLSANSERDEPTETGSSGEQVANLRR